MRFALCTRDADQAVAGTNTCNMALTVVRKDKINQTEPPRSTPSPNFSALEFGRRYYLKQGWAINFPKGPHEIVGLLWRAGPIG